MSAANCYCRQLSTRSIAFCLLLLLEKCCSHKVSVLFSRPLIFLWNASTLVELCVMSWLLSCAGWFAQVYETQRSSSSSSSFSKLMLMYTHQMVLILVLCFKLLYAESPVSKIMSQEGYCFFLKDSATIVGDNSTPRFVECELKIANLSDAMI